MPSTVENPGARRAIGFVDIATVVFASMVMIGFRLHAFDLPLETDECNYVYIAERLLAGDQLYIDIWDHQPPAIFTLYAAAATVLGRHDATFRLAAAAFSIVTLACVYAVTRRRCGWFYAAVAAALFSITSSDPGLAGEGCNREIFMNTFAMAALLLLANEKSCPARTFFAGLLLGVGSVFKYVLSAPWLCLAVWYAGRQWSQTRSPRKTIASIALFGAGPAMVWLVVTGYFAATGRFRAFGDAVFGYNLGYSAGDGGILSRFTGFFDPVFDVFTSAAPLWVSAAVGFGGLILMRVRKVRPILSGTVWRSQAVAFRNPHGLPATPADRATQHHELQPVSGCARVRRTSVGDGAIMAFAFGTFLAVCLPGKFWPHYYYLLHPVLILVTVYWLSSLERSGVNVRMTRSAALLVCGAVLVSESLNYALLSPGDLTLPHPVYRYRQAWSKAQGLRAMAVTDADDTIFVWGQDAGFYYYSQRRCASRYTMVGGLLEGAIGAAERRTILLEEMERNRPRLVFIVEPEFSELESFLKSNYVFASAKPFDMDDADPRKRILVVLTDRRNPVQPIDWEWRP